MESLPITIFKYASYANDLDTRSSVTGVMILLGTAPIILYSKHQNTVGSATYGSEIITTRIAIENLIGLRFKIQMMRIKVKTCST